MIPGKVGGKPKGNQAKESAVKKFSIIMVFCLVLVFGLALQASALVQTFPIAGSLDNLPVSGVAEFDINPGAGTITLGIWNTQANPTAIIQCISDLFFSLNDGNARGTLGSSAGVERTIATDGTFTPGGSVSTGWALTDGGGNYHLTVLGTPTAPTHLIIGNPDASNVYSNANSSITGAGGGDPHSPFLFAATRATEVLFTLDFTGLTDDTRVENVVMSFGTTEGRNVPIPPSAFLMGSGLLGLLGLGWRRKVRS
jgi:hypothetical protein